MSGFVYQGPAIPTVYDPQWCAFTNLNDAQVAAFRQFPPELVKYAQLRGFQALVTGGSPTVDQVIQIQQAVNSGVALSPSPVYSTVANLITSINVGTVTTQKQIDTSIAAVAPGSPSAKGGLAG